MPRTYKVTAEQCEEIKCARKKNRDKQVEKRLYAVQLRGEGLTNAEIGKQLEASPDVVSHWVSLYIKGGEQALMSKKRGGNHRNMSYAEEADFLSGYEKRAQAGQIVEVSEIEAAYEVKVGHPIGSGQIYRVLHRHGWRKVKPRSRHPKKATPEAIDASKKLTQL